MIYNKNIDKNKISVIKLIYKLTIIYSSLFANYNQFIYIL